ncbi:MAG: response regulator transcription factor [Clostridia bacterium]|nr:response regulator transcription factor [Clostridia bacterium]
MRIAVVEDDLQVQEQLKSYIMRFFEGRENQVRLTLFSDGDEILEDYRADYDLILLDIQMARLDGLTTAQKLRALDENVYLIFVTNLGNYAIKGYSVNALDFVLKPVNYLMLKAMLQRVEKLLAENDRRYLTLPTERGLVRLNVRQIYYVETNNHTSVIHTEKGEYSFRESMKNLESMLREYSFFRCNNCYLVNLAHVDEVDKNEVIVEGERLAISRPRYKAFMEALTHYIGGIKG